MPADPSLATTKTNVTAHEGRTIEPARSTVGDADDGRSPGSRVVARGTALPTYRARNPGRYIGGVRPAAVDGEIDCTRAAYLGSPLTVAGAATEFNRVPLAVPG